MAHLINNFSCQYFNESTKIPMGKRLSIVNKKIKYLTEFLQKYYSGDYIYKETIGKREVRKKEKDLRYYKDIYKYFSFLISAPLLTYPKIPLSAIQLKNLKQYNRKLSLKDVIELIKITSALSNSIVVYKVPVTLQEKENPKNIRYKIYTFYLNKYSVFQYEVQKYLNFGTQYLLQTQKEEKKQFEICTKSLKEM